MAPSGIAIFLGLLLASTTASALAADCPSLILNMSDCLSFVTSGSTAMEPEVSCCDGLKQVLKTDAACLCQAFKDSTQVNVTKALSLPAACRVSAPSVSNCGRNEIDAGGVGGQCGTTYSSSGVLGLDDILPDPADCGGHVDISITNEGGSSAEEGMILFFVTVWVNAPGTRRGGISNLVLHCPNFQTGGTTIPSLLRRLPGEIYCG